MADAAASPRVAVVGAGIVGSCIALALQKRGADVTLIDRDEPGRGCSFGNSGAISPGSVAPLAMPGVLSSLPTMLLDPEGPLHLRLGYLPRALPWLLRFVASARPDEVARNAARLAALHAGAIARHEALTRELGVPELFLQRGHLHLYPDEQALAKDAGGWRLRTQYGFRFEKLDRDDIVALEPGVGPRYQVGIFVADHATIVDPFRYVQAMVASFVGRGGKLRRADVRALTSDERGWHPIDGEDADSRFTHMVVATGAWAKRLLAPLGIHVALESQRGYHVQFAGARDTVSRTVVLADRKIFVTPMAGGLRVGGTVEIAGLTRPPVARRSALLERIARETFAGLDGIEPSRWMGHRPCTPDSLPIVGAAPGRKGLWLAIGHGHLGVTDSIATSQRIADGILGVLPDPLVKEHP